MIYFGTVLGGKHEKQEERSELMELVYMYGRKEPYTPSSIVAECERHLKILVNKYREDFESFGKVTFKISPSESWQMENDFKTVTNAKGLEIPKYPKDFKKLVEKDRQLAEYLCMNYEDLDSEDLGALLETVEQGFSWIMDLIESKDLLYKPKSGSNHAKRK